MMVENGEFAIREYDNFILFPKTCPLELAKGILKMDVYSNPYSKLYDVNIARDTYNSLVKEYGVDMVPTKCGLSNRKYI